METPKLLSVLALIFAFLFPLAGLVLAIVALVQINKTPASQGKGLAIAALIISLFFIVLPLSLLLLGSMSYFGAMNPSAMIPEKCQLTNSLMCVDHKVTDSQITLKLDNRMGGDIDIKSMKFTSDAIASGSCEAKDVGIIINGESKTVISDCKFVDTKTERNTYEISLNYVNKVTQIAHTIDGVLLAKKE